MTARVACFLFVIVQAVAAVCAVSCSPRGVHQGQLADVTEAIVEVDRLIESEPDNGRRERLRNLREKLGRMESRERRRVELLRFLMNDQP